jgi:hypothetical protein
MYRKKVNMISQMALCARLIEESKRLDPVIRFADEMYKSGLRSEDIDYSVMKKNIPDDVSLKFRNRIRDLEIGFCNIGDE